MECIGEEMKGTKAWQYGKKGNDTGQVNHTHYMPNNKIPIERLVKVVCTLL